MSRQARLIPVVVGILQRDEKILVGQRPADKPYGGYWEFPGGKIEKDELALDALKRELHEELGIEVVSATFWLEYPHTYPDKTVLLTMWRVTHFKGEPHSKENQTLRWATPSEMLELNLLEGNRAVIGEILINFFNHPS